MTLSVFLVASNEFSVRAPKPVVIFGSVALGAVPGTAIVFFIEHLWFGENATDGPVWFIYLAVLAISVAIGAVDYRNYIFRSGADHSADEAAASGGALFDRIDPMIGRDLISLSKQDHYLEVCTVGGKDIVLYRMNDAEADLRGVKGLRIHRSHWVALPHVEELRRSGSSYHVLLKDGRTLPVSRPNVRPLRKALSEQITEDRNRR